MKKNIILKISKVRDSQARLGLEVGRSEDWLEDSSGGGGDILRWTIKEFSTKCTYNVDSRDMITL